MEIQARINELMQDETFVKAFKAVAAPQDIVEPFKRDGEELNEAALDEIAGSGVFSSAGSVVYYSAGYLGARLAGWDKKKSKQHTANCATVGSIIDGALDWAIGI